MLGLSLASPAGDCGGAAAAFKARLGVVEVCGGRVWGLEAEVAALAAQVTGGGLQSRSVVLLGS